MKKIFFFLAAMALAITANAKVTTISPDAENDALRLAVHCAEDGDIIEMTEGTYVQCNNGYVAFDGKSVTIKAAEGANVVLQLQVPITLANGGKATLQGIKIDASRLTELANWYEHVIYANDATEGKQLVMDGCELYGFNMNKSAIYSKAENKLDLCRINNCYFHDVEKSCLFFEGTSIAELSVTNSTFANNIAKVTDSYYAGIIDVRNADAKVTVDHCTFYNCLLMNTDYAAITMKGPQAANVVISNNIFMLPEAIDGHRAIREYVEATNCMTFNYVKDNGGIHSSVTKTDCQLNVDPDFVDATNGNFALAEGSPALTAGTDGKAIGDPRWNVVAEPEPTTETVYFINAKKWAKVNVYAWTTDPIVAWPGAAATKEAEQIAGYDVYSYTLNAGAAANVIFNDGSSQTPDLVWTAGKYYVMDMGWLTKEEAETKLAAPLPETWNIVGAAGLMGKDWDLNAAENAMTKQEDGTYKLEKKGITIVAGTYEYKAAKDHGWTVAIPQDGNQKLTISTSGIYDVTFVLDVTAKKLTATATLKQAAVVIPTIVIAGDMNSWSQTKDKFTMSADSLTATFKATLAVKNYGFKMIVGGAWHSDGKTITRAANSTKFTGANSSTNSTLKADIAGEYLFTWEYATKTLTVTYPALPVKYNVTVTAEHGTVTGAGTYEEGKTATLTATAAEGYQFVNWTKGEEVVSTENPYTFTVTADVALVANFELIPPTKYNVTVTAENGTVEGAGEYEEGKTATLTATANEGYEFVNWTVGEEVVSTENPYTFTVTADIALVANFQATEPVVELPAASVRAWAYDLALAVEGEQYTFSYKATTAALATLIFTDVDGEELATKDLGLVEAGANTVVLAADELPAGQKVNWAVKLEAGAIANIVEVTDQTRGIYDFYNMMDVLVDNNPESEYFGRIYIQMAYDGANDAATDRSAVQKAGFYLYDQALNELNPESNVSIRPTLPEGYTMGDNRNKFHRLDIDPKTGNLTWCYNMAGQPAVFAVDAANLAGEATNLVAGIEGISRTAAHCFDAEGALYVMDLPAAGTIYKIVNGVATVFAATDSKWVNASMTLAADGKGGLWVAQNRGQIDTYYQLAHYTKDGVLDYAVYQGSENGFTGSSLRGALAYDAERQLLAQGRNGKVEVYSVAYDAETGVPALTLVATTPTVGNNIDGLHFDYAGDLYVVNSSKEKFQKFAMPTETNVCTTPAAAKYAFQLEAAGVDPVELVGVVKRALTIGESTVVLTHEADGTPHIYNIVGEEIAEISLEGVVPVDPENKGSYLAISDIAATEDGKLIANNYVRCQFGTATAPGDGYKRGTSYYYIWNDLAGAPAVWFTSQTTARSSHGDIGRTFAVKGTSTNAQVLVTAVHNNNRAVRMSLHTIIDGVYEDPNIDGGIYDSEYYMNFGLHTKSNYYKEETQGAEYYLLASPLAEKSWIIEAELSEPSEFLVPNEVGADYTANQEIAAGTLGKKYQGTTIVTIDDQHLMVAPYADAEGLLAGVKVLDITAGLASATEVAVADLDAAVEATAAATAVAVADNVLTITLVADATLHVLEVELEKGPATALDNIAVEAKAIKMIKNGQLIIIKNGVQYNVQGQVIK